MYIDERLKNVYNEAVDIIKKEFPDDEHIRRELISVSIDKAKRRHGVCKFVGDSCAISLSEHMLDCTHKEVLNTMIHELLHTYKDSHGHGGQWLLRAYKINSKYDLDIQRCSNVSGQPDLETRCKYFVECERCGKKIGRTRQSNLTMYPNKYIHTGCGGHFKSV